MDRLCRMLAALLLLWGCGEGEDKAPVDAGREGGVTRFDASVSPVQVAARPNQVTSVGAPCAAANACMGEKPVCMTSMSVLIQQISYPGGYCSAPCKKNIECGEQGECPVGEALTALPEIPLLTPDLITSVAPSNCYLRCTQDADCRTAQGYRCASILSALLGGAGGMMDAGAAAGGLLGGGFDIGALLTGPIRDGKYCLPPVVLLGDAGAGDAGPAEAGVADAGPADAGLPDASSLDAAALDAGAFDAGAPDAAPPDAGIPDAAGDDAGPPDAAQTDA